MLNKLLFISSIGVVAGTLMVTGVFGILKYTKHINDRFFPDERDFFETDGPTYEDYLFDATYTVPNTSVSIRYPSKGFYGWGVVRSDEIRSQDATDPSKQSIAFFSRSQEPDIEPLISLGIIVEPFSSMETVQELSKEGIGYGYAPDDLVHGSFVTINRHKYFVFKVSEDPMHTSWHAVALGKKEKVMVYLNYGTGRSIIANKAYRNNDQLFFEILSHINFD